MSEDIWLAIDEQTSRVVAFGNHSEAQKGANKHHKLSGNNVKVRKLKLGMIIYGDVV